MTHGFTSTLLPCVFIFNVVVYVWLDIVVIHHCAVLLYREANHEESVHLMNLFLIYSQSDLDNNIIVLFCLFSCHNFFNNVFNFVIFIILFFLQNVYSV